METLFDDDHAAALGIDLVPAARIEGATRTYVAPLLVADTTRAAAGDLAGCEWVEIDEVAVNGRSQWVTLYVPLAVTDVTLSRSTPENEQEITPFHEQLRLWRLARDALRGHHGQGTRKATAPSARAVAHARLTELLAARPASLQLHAPARTGSPPNEPQPQNSHVDLLESPSA